MSTKQYNYAIGYLRAFVVALVVAHHSALGYMPFATAPAATLLTPPALWQGLPVLDPHRWFGSIVLIIFNDNFFMSLLFFLSGLFFWQGLQRKGTRSFLKDRLLRLGIPFLVMAAIFSPIAYFPSYLQTSAHAGPKEFWRQWTTLHNWPAGPAWFVWVLLLFDSIATLLFTMRPSWALTLTDAIKRITERPMAAILAFLAVDALAYVPLALAFSAIAWSGWGPFSFQSSRILHYFVYFLTAIGVGAAGIDNGILALEGRLSRGWLTATVGAVIAFGAALAFTFFGAKGAWHPAGAAALFVVSCAATSLACIAIFLRSTRRASPVWDSLAANSYGIYLFHYMFVSWTQYALLTTTIPSAAKFGIVLSVALLLSWGCSIAVRRSPLFARIV